MAQALKNSERIRPVVNRADLKQYAKLEAQASSRFPPFHKKWTVQNFIQILNATGMMAQSYVRNTKDILKREEVIGFILYKLHEDNFEILNLVSEGDRPDVIGKLIAFMKDRACKPDAKRSCVTFTVRETDEEWQRILSAAGFRAKLVRDHFDHPVEDGYKFTWENKDVADSERRELSVGSP